MGSWCTEHKSSGTLSILHIQVQMEATFFRLGTWYTAHIRSGQLGIIGQI